MKNLVYFSLAVLSVIILAVAVRPQGVYGRMPAASPLSGQIRFQQSSVSIAENGGSVEIVIERINGSEGEILVSADTFDGTAVAGQDYPATAESVTFGSGEIQKTISIPIIDNNTTEPDETFVVTLTVLSGPGSTTQPDTITVTIVDNDSTPPGILHFSSASYAVLEDAGLITITVNRSGGTADPVQVSYATFDDSATFGLDYMPALGTLTFPAGATEQTFTVELLDDPGAEGSETFTMALSNVVGVASLGEPANATVTILDNETASFVYLPTIQR